MVLKDIQENNLCVISQCTENSIYWTERNSVKKRNEGMKSSQSTIKLIFLKNLSLLTPCINICFFFKGAKLKREQ